MSRPADDERLIIHGQVHLSLHTVARCFDVQISWLEAVHESGLLGPGERIGTQVAVAAAQLDRVACIVRLHFHQGVDLSGIVLLLGSANQD